MENKEIVICSAIRAPLIKNKDGSEMVRRGHRHPDCLNHFRWMLMEGMITKDQFPSDPGLQGFITSKNRFVDRKEAMTIQKNAGIESVDIGGYSGGELYSEDLY